MGYFRGFILVGAVLALLALTASSASASVLCKSTTTPCQSAYGIGTKLDASLTGSFQLESKGSTHATCTGSTIKGSTTTAGGELEAVTVPVESLTWSGCNQTTHTLKAGELAIFDAGGDNGLVEFKGTEVTLQMNGVTCTYRPGVGTLKGGESPSIEINAVATKLAGSFLCPTEANWVAKYEVTEPKPIYVEPDYQGAVLCKSTTTPCQSAYGIGTKLDASLTGSFQLESKGSTHATCTGSTIKGSTTTAGGELEAVTVPVESLTWSGCNQTTHTLKAGELAIFDAGGDNGLVEFKGTEVTLQMNGVTCTYRPGVGTLKGGESPSIEINAVATKLAGSFLCPTEANWVAKYEVTEPKPIYVEPDYEGAVLCKSTTTPCQSAYGIGTKLDASLTGSFQLESKGSTHATCTGSTIKGSTTTAGGELEAVTVPVESLTWSGCNQTTHTLKAGELAIFDAGGDNGLVEFKGTEVTLQMNGVTCTYRPGVGTLKGGESPSIEINAVATKLAGSFLCPTEANWVAKYEVTEPKPIYVEPS